MPAPVDPQLVDIAVSLVRAAGQLTLEHFRSPDLAVDWKEDGTPVTTADRDAERLLRTELGQRYPSDGLIGEEEAETVGTSGRRWIMDPIDGTKAFTHGVPLYTNLLALEDDTGIALGVINMPALGETVWAGRGQGCFCNGRPVHVGDHRYLRGAYVTTSGFDAWSERQLLATLTTRANLRTWGDGYGYALVATGRVDAMVDARAELYDLAPMPVILAEAGGRFTSIDGHEGPDQGSGVATNGRIHDALLGILAN